MEALYWLRWVVPLVLAVNAVRSRARWRLVFGVLALIAVAFNVVELLRR